MLLKRELGNSFTEPPSHPNLSQFRMIDMFTSVLTTEKKDQVLQSFSEIDGVLRLVIATTAFGMGIDCPNIRRILHWGMPNNLEEYVQETGRSGRDGEHSTAILYEGAPGKHASTQVKQYVSNSILHVGVNFYFSRF